MRYSVNLRTQNYREGICECLRELRDKEKLPFQIEEYRHGNSWIIQCHYKSSSTEDEEEINKESIAKKIYKYYLAGVLAEAVLRHWEKDYFKQILRKKKNIKNENWQWIIEKALYYLNSGFKQEKGYHVNRKTILISQILNNLERNPVFDIEGFLRFRAYDYKNELGKAIEFAINEYTIEKEYVEFIRLLKHFVDTQKPSLDRLHVGITAQGEFLLYDNEGINVTDKFLENYQIENAQELGYEDLLISALIAAAPRQITLHIRYAGYISTLKTIQNVFGERVQSCQGCTLCKNFDK